MSENVARAYSIESDPLEGSRKSKRPPNTAFRQQRLKSWQPLLSPQSILPFLLLLSALFAPIGIGLLVITNRVQDLVIDYSSCGTASTAFAAIPLAKVKQNFRVKPKEGPKWRYLEDSGSKTCEIQFEVPNDINKPVYIYYKLTNFYQNHRKYVQSFDLDQLKGKAVPADQLSSKCKPLDSRDGKIIYPCGLIANSFFNDTFQTVLRGVDGTRDYSLTNSGISWHSDRKRYKKTQYAPDSIAPPPNWDARFPNGYTEENLPNLAEWEEFHVWMRTAGLPSFYKLALKGEGESLPAGTYTIQIDINYPVSIFGGTKSLILTTNSIIGTRNHSLGIAYLIVAGIAFLFSVIFLAKVIIQPRKLGDHTYLNFNQQNTSSMPEPTTPQHRDML